MRVSTFVISPTSRGNALGRALCLALAGSRIGPTYVWALDDGALWVGAGQFDMKVRVFRRKPELVEELRREADKTDLIVLWFVKGLGAQSRTARFVRRNIRSPLLIMADFDDDDAELAREFAAHSPVNMARLAARRQLPASIVRSQRRLVEVCDARTVATQILGEHVPGARLPTLRVPHIRGHHLTRAEVIAPAGGRDRNIKLGFLGTIRSHKGAHILRRLLESNVDFSLVCFDQAELIQHPRVERLLPTTPLAEAYARIDVLVVPSSLSPASDRQLPAKMVDASSFGCPIVATRTAAIEELFGSTREVSLVDNWEDIHSVSNLIRSVVERTARVADWQPDATTPESAALEIVQFISSVSWRASQRR